MTRQLNTFTITRWHKVILRAYIISRKWYLRSRRRHTISRLCVTYRTWKGHVISAMHLHASLREGHALSGAGGRAGRGALRWGWSRSLPVARLVLRFELLCFAPVFEHAKWSPFNLRTYLITYIKKIKTFLVSYETCSAENDTDVKAWLFSWFHSPFMCIAFNFGFTWLFRYISHCISMDSLMARFLCSLFIYLFFCFR